MSIIEPPKGTILVVDDEPAILRYVAGFLEDAGYRVLTANSGATALQQAREYQGAIDLLLSDFQMPAMSGMVLATQLSKERPQVKVLMMSGFTAGMLVLNKGWHFLAKPFVPAQLLTLIQGLVTPWDSRTGAEAVVTPPVAQDASPRALPDGPGTTTPLPPRAAVVVAHPDDETLWCGGYIMAHPEFRWRIVSLCRASDPDRAPKFRQVLQRFGAEGEMADLDDGPEQTPLPPALLGETAAGLLQGNSYDLVLTHGPLGEYTRHRRHAECCRAVVELWRSAVLKTRRLWMFAYEDGGQVYLPHVRRDADRRDVLPDDIWSEKRRLMVELYGFGADSWEVETTPRHEGFWCFDSAEDAVQRAAQWEDRS